MAPVIRVPDHGDGLDDITIDDLPENIGELGSSSDSDEDPPNGGYQLLPQDPEYSGNNFPDSMNDIDDGQATAVVIHSHFLEALESNSASCAFEETIPKDNQPMDSDHAEIIKAAMAGFMLPSANLPDWASVIPEEEWKSALIAQIKSKKSSISCTLMSLSNINTSDK